MSPDAITATVPLGRYSIATYPVSGCRSVPGNTHRLVRSRGVGVMPRGLQFRQGGGPVAKVPSGAMLDDRSTSFAIASPTEVRVAGRRSTKLDRTPGSRSSACSRSRLVGRADRPVCRPAPTPTGFRRAICSPQDRPLEIRSGPCMFLDAEDYPNRATLCTDDDVTISMFASSKVCSSSDPQPEVLLFVDLTINTSRRGSVAPSPAQSSLHECQPLRVAVHVVALDVIVYTSSPARRCCMAGRCRWRRPSPVGEQQRLQRVVVRRCHAWNGLSPPRSTLPVETRPG